MVVRCMIEGGKEGVWNTNFESMCITMVIIHVSI